MVGFSKTRRCYSYEPQDFATHHLSVPCLISCNSSELPVNPQAAGLQIPLGPLLAERFQEKFLVDVEKAASDESRPLCVTVKSVSLCNAVALPETELCVEVRVPKLVDPVDVTVLFVSNAVSLAMVRDQHVDLPRGGSANLQAGLPATSSGHMSIIKRSTEQVGRLVFLHTDLIRGGSGSLVAPSFLPCDPEQDGFTNFRSAYSGASIEPEHPFHSRVAQQAEWLVLSSFQASSLFDSAQHFLRRQHGNHSAVSFDVKSGSSKIAVTRTVADDIERAVQQLLTSSLNSVASSHTHDMGALSLHLRRLRPSPRDPMGEQHASLLHIELKLDVEINSLSLTGESASQEDPGAAGAESVASAERPTESSRGNRRGKDCSIS
eukprot:TRINITY_DN4559_c0_g1_i1.p1 TRINITY_DN4559_c0_g1~~TRINITY_DN4559_c0_g1_i1.p1  ORF type:complete len:394 (-),score=31.92 TRINITY_DN4559_c0_g1_i1:77-1210(-)